MSDSHGHGDTLPNETYINTAGVAVWVVGSVALLPFLLLGVYSYFQVVSQDMLRERVGAVPTTELNEARAMWDTENSSYGVVDKAGERYRLPMDKAKSLYIADHKRMVEEEKQRLAEEAAAAAELEEGEGLIDGDELQLKVQDMGLIQRIKETVQKDKDKQ